MVMNNLERMAAAVKNLEGREEEFNEYFEWLLTTEEWREDESRYRDNLALLLGLAIQSHRINRTLFPGNEEYETCVKVLEENLQNACRQIRTLSANDLRSLELSLERAMAWLSSTRVVLLMKQISSGAFKEGQGINQRISQEIEAYLVLKLRVKRSIEEYAERVSDQMLDYLSEPPVQN